MMTFCPQSAAERRRRRNLIFRTRPFERNVGVVLRGRSDPNPNHARADELQEKRSLRRTLDGLRHYSTVTHSCVDSVGLSASIASDRTPPCG